ncbi:MAG: PE-PGRS family protein [Sedimentisphaerales bacterium]
MVFDTANRGFAFGLAQTVMMTWAAIGCAVSADCPKFLAGHKMGTVESPLITEASGIAASRKNPGVLWVHNDKGPPCVYAMTPRGKLLGTYNLVGARNYNWEDIAIGPGPEPNVDYLYIGDIGDNSARRKSVRVYRVAEPNVVRPIDRHSSPQVDANQSPLVAAISDFATIEMIYPDGPRDAETLMIDPLTKDLYIISKEGRSKVYRAAYPQSAAGKTTLEYVAKLPWGAATAGDISPDGQLIIVRSYFSASVWPRPRNGPLWRAFDKSECEVPIIAESQGEAICFDANGAGYYTTSENRHQPIYYFPMDRQGEK